MSDEFNLYPLHVFRLVAKFGSVTRAARELFISQPAVSAHLRSLEQRFKESLFERTPRGMALTTVGMSFLEQVNRLFAIYDDLPLTFDAVRGRVQGEIVIAASSTPGAYLVPELLQQFQKLYPESRSVLRIGDSAEVLEWLLSYEVPLGIIGEMNISESLQSVEIGSDRLQLITAGSDTLSGVKQVKSEHLRGRMLLLRERGSSTRAGAKGLLGERLKDFERVVEVPSTETIKQSVIAGLGVAVLSSWATKLEESVGLLRPVRDTRLKRQRKFYLVRRKDRVLTASAAALWDYLSTCKPAVRPD